MADKFLRHGETFCGDGTASNAAASAGAVGAWNDINVFEGTAPASGALADGDVVYIRSKDAADADIVRTIAATTSLGKAGVVAPNLVTWILDNGDVWPGINGTLTYTHASTYTVTTLTNNRIAVMDRGALVIKNTAVNPAANTLLTNNAHLIGAKVDFKAKTGINPVYINTAAALFENCIVDCGKLGNNAIPIVCATAGAPVFHQIIGCDFVLNNPTPGAQPLVGAYGNSYTAAVDIIGCRVLGGVGYSGQTFCNAVGSHGTRIRMIGCDIPKAMTICGQIAAGYPSIEIEAVGCDGGIGSHIEKIWGYATSRSDNNPPTLSASLPDSASSPWSYRVYPRNPTQQVPMQLPSVKLFTGDPAVKTLTLEMLVADTLTPTKDKVWGVLTYTDDATGALKSISSRDFGTLVSSSAGWTFDAWGTVNFQKYKIALTTPTAVKKDTLIIFTLFGTMASATADDILFVDPDFGIV